MEQSWGRRAGEREGLGTIIRVFKKQAGNTAEKCALGDCAELVQGVHVLVEGRMGAGREECCSCHHYISFLLKKASGMQEEQKSQLWAERPRQASRGLCRDRLTSGCSCSMKLPGFSLLHCYDRPEHVLKRLTESGSSSRACGFVLHAATGWV